jgi:hypothetical protein
MDELLKAEIALKAAQFARDAAAQRLYLLTRREADRRRQDQRAWEHRQHIRLLELNTVE